MKAKETVWPHSGHRERLRKLIEENSLKNFPPYLILEFILTYGIPYKDTKPTAYALLDKYGGSIKRVLSADIDELVRVKNMTRNAALLLKTFSDIYDIYFGSPPHISTVTSDNLLPYLRSLFERENAEKLMVLCLDGENKLLCTETAGVGDENTVIVTTQKILDIAEEYKASKVILAHNHPSQFAMPSQADYDSTDRLGVVMAQKGICLIDHFILCDECAFSFFLRCRLSTDSTSTYPFYKHEKGKKQL